MVRGFPPGALRAEPEIHRRGTSSNIADKRPVFGQLFNVTAQGAALLQGARRIA